VTAPSALVIPTGIAPLDERIGGIQRGGTHLLVGTPGPAKMVAALQFLHAGIANGERCALVTSAEIAEILEVARAWGFSLDDAWTSGALQVVGFRTDFELRAIRTIAPEEILEELDTIITSQPARIAIDPGTMFLTGGAKTLLGTAFMAWARRQPSTVFITLSVDGDPPSLPSSADWLVSATTARLVLARRPDGLYQITVTKALPGADERDQTITLELRPGGGLIKPTSFPTRRGSERGDVNRNRLMVVSLGGTHAEDLADWAGKAFQADIVSEPFAAVAKVQADASYGCVLVHAPRARVREALQACRVLRPLTRAAIVFASDDAIRSTDRIAILESGADDCLSGGIDFRELGLRIKQSMATGAKPVVTTGEHLADGGGQAESTGGRVSRDAFRLAFEERSTDPDRTFFCVLDVRPAQVKPSELEDGLASLVRTDEHDLVSGGADRCLVLLQGAREHQLGQFMTRLKALLQQVAGKGTAPEVAVLSHPSDAERIRQILGAAGGEAR